MDARRVRARTERYLGVPAVVGYEQPLRDVLVDELHELGADVETRDGAVVAAGGPAAVSAHLDRHGFVTAGSGRLTYAAASDAGEHRALSPRLAASVCQRAEHERVVAYDPATGSVLGEGMAEHGAHCGIGPDIDLTVDELAGLDPGVPVAFAHDERSPETWLRGQIDNALSVAIAMELLASGFDGTVLFTSGEEAGRSWKAIVEWFGERTLTDLLVLDTSPFDDDEFVRAGAVVLRHADAGATFDAATADGLAESASRAQVPVVWKDDLLVAAGRSLGRTELGRVIDATGGRITGATVQVPTTDYHTNHELTSLDAIDACLRVLGQQLL